MIRLDSDRVHWVLVVALVALSLLLAVERNNSTSLGVRVAPTVEPTDHIGTDSPKQGERFARPIRVLLVQYCNAADLARDTTQLDMQ